MRALCAPVRGWRPLAAAPGRRLRRCGARGCAPALRRRLLLSPVTLTQRGPSTRRLCCVATYACAVGALVLLWLVYPKDYSYGAAASTGLLFYPGQARALQTLPGP